MCYDGRGCCHYELAEWLGDALLRFLSVAYVMASHPKASEKVLSPGAEQILCNKALFTQAKTIGLPLLALTRPFESAATLPTLRKSAFALKAQADLMEALLGVLAVAALRATADAPRLSTALTAAHFLFAAAVLPPSSPPEQLDFPSQLANLNRLEARRGTSPSSEGRDEAAASLASALGVSARPDLLWHVCVWNKETPFERLEFYGDAFLQVSSSKWYASKPSSGGSRPRRV